MRASGYERVATDFYIEPRWIVDALLEVERFEGRSWDPSCGGGNIPRAMQARGLECRGSDIVDRGHGEPGVDFLHAVCRAHNIVSNPPYGLIEPYVERALSVTTSKVALLARLALLEGMKRRALFARTPLARVWVSSKRVSMPPGGSNIEAKGGAIAFAWFVWDHSHAGAPTLGWV